MEMETMTVGLSIIKPGRVPPSESDQELTLVLEVKPRVDVVSGSEDGSKSALEAITSTTVIRPTIR